MLSGRDERTTLRSCGLLAVGTIQEHWPEDGEELHGYRQKLHGKKFGRASLQKKPASGKAAATKDQTFQYCEGGALVWR